MGYKFRDAVLCKEDQHSMGGKCKVADRFYTALFSAVEQTYCALVACSSE